MPADWKRFGNLLTELLWQIKNAGGPPLEDLQEIIGQALGKQSGASIAKWRRGQAIVRQQDVEGLVRELAAWARKVSVFRDDFRRDLRTLLTLADLPSIDVLRGKLLGVLNAPASKLVTLLNTPASQLARVIKAKAERDGKTKPEAAPAA